MNIADDTFILLWGGPVSPSSGKKVMYWAVNHKGRLCGIIIPESTWLSVEQGLKNAAESAPYLSVAVTRLSTQSPEIRLITIPAGSLYDFCFLKTTTYRSRQTPRELKLEPDKVMGHIGLADAPITSLHRSGKPEKGEFFTFIPDKQRIDLYYLIKEGETTPPKVDTQILWGLKGFSLPYAAPETEHKPAEYEKLILGRSEIKPRPLWLRRLLGTDRRRKRR